MGYVSLLIHHDGILVEGKHSFEYEGGEIFYWEDRDVNLISYLDIEDELKKLGYGDITKMAYFIPGMPKKEGIRYVKKYNDVDMLEMLKRDENRDIHVFVEAFEGRDKIAEESDESDRVLSGDDDLPNDAFEGYLTDDIAMGKDGNDQILLVAWAVVEGEKEETRLWFPQIFEEFEIRDGTSWTFISDQQKGLIYAIY
ncbi:hypothetical protein GH714_017427 [Hevea brasiliensis]|uniref:PB1-like domain-containing protein n=1 Tax=Hevea brasiliensis TaxID=3981 RepID=A0A6A6LS95_HEVBR|nr:hypothetical protein GH714_017427 [Hevea brasiliensis]